MERRAARLDERRRAQEAKEADKARRIADKEARLIEKRRLKRADPAARVEGPRA
jgi:hypothetical protein